MSGGRNGTPRHGRQTYLSPQRAPGALDLIAAIMTFEETMTKLCEVWRSCRASPAESSGLLPDGDMPECFLAAFVLEHLGDEVTMTIGTNSRKVIGWSDGSAGGTDCYPPDRPGQVSIRVASSRARPAPAFVIVANSVP
jgi:hypothetical protein